MKTKMRIICKNALNCAQCCILIGCLPWELEHFDRHRMNDYVCAKETEKRKYMKKEQYIYMYTYILPRKINVVSVVWCVATLILSNAT